MRKFFQVAFLIMMTASFMAFCAVGYMGFIALSLIWGGMFTLSILGDDKPKGGLYKTFKWGDEWALEDEFGAVRMSSKAEVNKLHNEGRIVPTFKK